MELKENGKPVQNPKENPRIWPIKPEIQLVKELCETGYDITLDHIQFNLLTSEKESEVRERLRKHGL